MSFVKNEVKIDKQILTNFYSNQVLIEDSKMIFEVGKIAKQTSGSVLVRYGDSVVLVTVCALNKKSSKLDFFPLTCDYVEKSYAAGKIPGGFFKREARLGEHEILTSRIIDRSVRPLFPDGYLNEVQIIATVLSYDDEHDTDVMALCGASMALHVSELPFSMDNGPIAGVRVGRVDGKFIANPSISERKKSDIDVFVSSTKDSIVMVEGGGNEVSESDLIDSIFFAKKTSEKIILAIKDMRSKVGKNKLKYISPKIDDILINKIETFCFTNKLNEALSISDKLCRYSEISEIKEKLINDLSADLGDDYILLNLTLIKDYFNVIKKNIIRKNIIKNGIRIDGRKNNEIRKISSEINILPRSHGSAIFTRGETQSLVSLTLGTKDDEQRVDSLNGDYFKRFMINYNFLPFCVNEVRMLRTTSRREIGHGALAEKAFGFTNPISENFPYTIRLVSEITESNGSSSMATVCASTLAMLDGGIKLKSPVSGIAMGLIKEDDDIVILSDILGDEDSSGDMDFKVCGTENGITAIQMDIKVSGLSNDILSKALEQARTGRCSILNEMEKTINNPRENLSDYAPKIVSFKINPNKIRDVIGAGGKVIRDIILRSSAKIDINDDGLVQISAVNAESVNKAIDIIKDLTREAKLNMVYKGLVKKILNFGAFIEIFPGTEGLCHISELADRRVESVNDILREGDEVNVAVLNIENDGKIRLSKKSVKDKNPGEFI